MIPFPTTGQDSLPDSSVQRIIRGAFGIPLELTEAPTTAGGQLSHSGDSGYFGTNLYIRLGDTTYRFAGTAV